MPREVYRPGASARKRAETLAASLSEFPFGLRPPRKDPITVFLESRPIDPLHDNMVYLSHQRNNVSTEQDEHSVKE